MGNDIAKIIRARRTEIGRTQREVAEHVGVARPVVAKWERGETRPSAERLPRLAEILELPVERLVVPKPTRGRRRRPEPCVLRRRTRLPYPISATIEHMLRLRGYAQPLYDVVHATLSQEEYLRVVEEWPRDTRHELMATFHVLHENARMITTSPELLDCPVMILDDYLWVYGGNQRQPAILWEGQDEWFVMFSQVRVRGAGRWAYRLDFLVYYKRRGQAGRWLFIELDGKDHEDTPDQDQQRAEGVGIPELRYDNAQVRRPDFFERLLEDMRAAAQLGAKWAEERAEKAETEKLRRDKVAAAKRATPDGFLPKGFKVNQAA